LALGVAAAVVAIVATAFALGGSGTSHQPETTAAPAVLSAPVPAQRQALAPHGSAGALKQADRPVGAAGNGGSTATSTEGSAPADEVGDDVTATRVVKTGTLGLQVAKGTVAQTVTKLSNLAVDNGGYVSQSRTDDVVGSPSGEVTLRMPAARFGEVVTGAEQDGHETSLTTNAHDVTGKYVDLSARLTALQRTRETYLTILGRAKTIGATLEVQQRVDDVQQQIEELQGQLKVLRNQSADGTLTVDVTQTGSAAVPQHHQRHGIGKAWHTSVSRFGRGIDVIVAALGPLLLAVLVFGVIALAIALGWRGVRRFNSQGRPAQS
jgi:hypothetical protein